MNWKYTIIQHFVRIQMGLSINDYCVCDVIYKSQTHPAHTVEGWSDKSYRKIGSFFGISPGTVHNIIDKCVEAGFIEVNPAKTKLKRTTEKWYNYAYLDEEKILSEEGLLQSVQKLNVQKLNGKRSEIERKRSDSEQKRSEIEHIKGSNEFQINSFKRRILSALKKDVIDFDFEIGFCEKEKATDESGYYQACINFLKEEKEKNSEKKEKEKPLIDQAVKLVEVFNEFAERNVSTARSGKGSKNVSWVKGLLSKGYSFEEIERMIIFICWKWKDNPKMRQHLEPETIFKRHGEKYIGQANEAYHDVNFKNVLAAAKESEETTGGIIKTGDVTKNVANSLSNW